MIASPALDLLMLKVVKEQAVFPPLKFHLKRDKIVNMCDFKEHCKFVFILKLINLSLLRTKKINKLQNINPLDVMEMDKLNRHNLRYDLKEK
jgi:hypothetical protein